VVEELKVGVEGREVLTAPLHHAVVDVDPHVAARSWPLQQELPGLPPASASEVEDGIVKVGREDEMIENGTTGRIVKYLGIGLPYDGPHFERR
jgi:hypothetical protein